MRKTKPLSTGLDKGLSRHKNIEAARIRVELMDRPYHATLTLHQEPLKTVRIVEIATRGRQPRGFVDHQQTIPLVDDTGFQFSPRQASHVHKRP
jgi:hypothetical protein